MKKTLSIVLLVLLVFLAVACSPETHKHTWDEGKVTLEPSCTEAGVKTYTCTVCNETKTESIAKKGHSHAEDAKPIYTAGLTTKPTCISEGKAYYVCQNCDELYLTSVPRDYTNHVYWDGSEYRTLDSDALTDYFTWSETAEIESTYFTPAKYVGYCNTCGKACGFTKNVLGADGKAEYKKINSTWVYYDKVKGKEYFLDVAEGENEKITAHLIVSTHNGNAVETEAAEDISATSELSTGNSVRTLTVKNAVSFGATLTEKSGVLVLTAGNASSHDSVIDYSDETKATLKECVDHNHLYGTDASDSGKATFVGNDPYFAVEEFLGLNLLNKNSHFVSCSVCGLQHFAVNHYKTSVTDISCAKCGYLESKYSEVTISYVGDPSIKNASTAAVAGSEAATKSAGGDTNTTEATYADALLAAQNAVKAAMSSLSEIGYNLDGSDGETAYNNLSDLLKTNGSVTNSLAVAYSQAYNLGYKNGARTETKASSNFSDYNTVLEAAATALGNAAGGKEDFGDAAEALNAWGLIKAEEGSEFDSFVVPTGTILHLDYNKYASTNGTEYAFAKGTSWLVGEDAIEKGTGIVALGDGWHVTGDGSLGFALSK